MSRFTVLLVLSVLTMPFAGCARPAGTIFSEGGPTIVWPSPPDTARIRYVGQLASETDLKAAKSGWAALSESLGGPRAARGVSTPAGIAISDDEKLYVTDPAQHAVHVFDLRSRRYSTISNAGDQNLFTPADVAIAGSQVFVTDSALHAVLVYDTAGKFQRSFGADRLKRPVGISFLRANAPTASTQPAVSAEPSPADRLYVIDTGAHACISFNTAGIEQMRFGRRGSAPGEFNYPTDIAADARTGLIIADTLNFRVQRFTIDGQFVASIGQRGDGAGSFALPKGVAIDAAGRTFVVDAQFENVQIFSPQGELLIAIGREGRGAGEFWLPNGAAVSPDGRLWVADGYNRRVQVFQMLGVAQ